MSASRVRAIILDMDGKILFGKTPEGIYRLPGGKINEGEHPVDALKREMLEETGIAEFEDADYLFDLHDNSVFAIVPKLAPFTPNTKNDPEQEFEALEWFNPNLSPSNLDEFSEDILFKFFKETLREEEPVDIEAGVVEVYVDGEKIAELDDEEIQQTLPKLALEQTQGKKVTYKQVLDDGSVIDFNSNPNPVMAAVADEILDELILTHFPEEKTRPAIKSIATNEYLAKTKCKDLDGRYVTTVYVNSEAVDDDDLLRQILAHEMIHHCLYQKYGLTIDQHGIKFNRLADIVNKKEGENYVTHYADDTNFEAI